MSIQVLHDESGVGFSESQATQHWRHALLLLTGAALSVTFGIVLLAGANLPKPVEPAAPLAPAVTPPVWLDIIRPLPLFDLTAPELAKAPLVYVARRHGLGGGRRDILTFGTPESPVYLRLDLYRVGAEAAPFRPLAEDLADAAGRAGIRLVHALPPADMATRFGRFEVADVRLAGKAGNVPCLGFRGVALSGAFRISGFACGSQTLSMARPTLGCLIDRLDLNAAGDDQALASFFAASELKRNPACAGGELRPTANHANWLDRNDAPPPLQDKKLL